MLSKKEILTTLTNLKIELNKRFKVKKLGLFGSYVSDEYNEISDIDILVDFDDDADLFNFTGLALFLEEQFKCKVDVVPINALREELKDSVLKSVIYT